MASGTPGTGFSAAQQCNLRIFWGIGLPVYGFRNTGDGVLNSAAMQPAIPSMDFNL
jgi:hypothetical protein